MVKIKNWSGLFLKLFLLTFPWQIQTILYKADFFSGQFNNFSSFFFSLSEVFLLLAILSYGLQRLVHPSHQQSLLENFTKLELFLSSALTALLLWMLLSAFWADDKTLALLTGLRMIELLGLVYLFVAEVLPKNVLLKYLAIGGVLQVLIGMGQYFKQMDLGLTFLGEPHLAINNLNIAKINLGGEKILRAYGTFAHANILGGYLVVCMGLIIQSMNTKNWWKRLVVVLAFTAGILLSFSRSAWLAVLALIIVILTVQNLKINWKQLVLGLSLLLFVLVVFSLDRVIWARAVDFSMQSWDERLIFSEIARGMIFQHPWLGIGAGNFVLKMSDFYSGVLSPWLYQPVHNFFLMVVSELGLIGLVLWLSILGGMLKQIFDSTRRIVKSARFYWKAYWALLLAMLVLSLLDHYFYTAWPGQVLVFLVMGIIWRDYRERRVELVK